MSLNFDNIIDTYAKTIQRTLLELDNAQLQELLKNESKLDEIIKNQKEVNLLPEMRNNSVRLCKWYADLNMTAKPKFEELKGQLRNHAIDLRCLNDEIHELKRKLDLESEARRLDVADAIIKVATRQAEEASEKISDDFMAGRISIDDFLSRYDETRKLYHTRRLKSDKLEKFLDSNGISRGYV